MKLFNSIKKRVRQLGLGVAATVALATVGLATVGSTGTAFAAGNDISSGNSSTSCSDLIKKVRASKELQAIYADSRFGGLTPNNYDNFAKNCKHGVATSGNKIIVNGKTYADNVGSIGRIKSYQGSDPKTFNISGAGTYYGNLDSKAFKAGTSSIPVDVLLNASGELQFAVMTTTCGNPVYFNYKTPTYSCDELHVKSAGDNTYQLTTDASAAHGAVIDHVEYSINGKVIASRKDLKQVVTYTTTKDVTATVTVFVKLPNGKVVTVGAKGDCAKTLKYTAPKAVVACNLLTIDNGTINNANGDVTHVLTATASAKNAKIQKYTFTFGNGKTQVVTTSATSAKSSAQVYPAGSSYTAKVLVTFVTNTGATVTDGNDGNCAKKITVNKLPTNLACDSLTANKVVVDPTTGDTRYSFTVNATPTRATITSYVIKFGDGDATQTITTSAKSVTSQVYTYVARANQYNVSATVNGTDVYGKKFTNVTSPKCQTSFKVSTPECKPGVPVGSPQCSPSSLACVNLTATPGTIDATGKQTYSFTVTATANNAKITNYAYNFGDGTAVQNTTNTTVSHQYAPSANAYTASVIVSGTDAAGKPITAPASADCAKTFTVKTPECKPGVPVNSPECSTLTCTNLSVVPGDRQTDGSQTFTLNATATADQATITNYVFHFGDGSQDQSIPSTTTTASTTHVYAPSTATQTASVTVFGKDAAGNTIQSTNANCTKPVTNTPPTPQTPGVTITKLVNGVKTATVAIGAQFTYTLKVTNNGQQDLTNVVVTDTPDNGVTLTTTQAQGTVSGNTWTYTIPALAVGQSVSFDLVAIVPAYQSGNIKNTACVNAPEVNPTNPSQPDNCDYAYVNVNQPPAQVLPAVLPNTGAGSVIGVFGAAAIIGMIGHRIFLSRRLNRQ